MYIAERFDLYYTYYDYDLEYDAIEIKDNEVFVKLRESHEVIFKQSEPYGIVSKLDNLGHAITLKKYDGVWRITGDTYNDEIFRALNSQTKAELLDKVEENYQESLKQQSAGVKALGKPSAVPLGLNNYTYNRTLAKNYADTYWNTTNPPYYLGLGPNDCANFVSQAIYAGEGKTPPDTSGMTTDPNRSYTYDWYYVWNNSGSPPWIRVPEQYSFITGNTNRIGPYGSGTTNYCNTQVGDVVQLYNSSDGWFHEGIITQIINPCGGMQFYYVNAHTVNRYQYPLINWSIYTLRYIRISGWRGN